MQLAHSLWNCSGVQYCQAGTGVVLEQYNYLSCKIKTQTMILLQFTNIPNNQPSNVFPSTKLPMIFFFSLRTDKNQLSTIRTSFANAVFLMVFEQFLCQCLGLLGQVFVHDSWISGGQFLWDDLLVIKFTWVNEVVFEIVLECSIVKHKFLVKTSVDMHF